MREPTEPALRGYDAYRLRVLNHQTDVGLLLRFFEFEHLPAHLQAVSKPFHDLAHAMVDQALPGLGEVEAGLRKLLEAKDCLVRAALG